MNAHPERSIAAACEDRLERHGDTHLGNGYTRSPQEAQAQYAMMLELIRENSGPVTVLDFGCGLAHLFDHIKARPELAHLDYTGVDLSEKYLELARLRQPGARLMRLNILEDDSQLPVFDYVIMNGVFNYRGAISRGEMVSYWQRLLRVAFAHCRKGLAFNAMSKLVDWERDDLFHLSLDEVAAFVGPNLSRHFVIRHDYPAYEFTTYVYRSATQL